MSKRKYSIDEKMFDELNNNVAYWLGLLYADGSCSIENKISLWLSIKDRDILYQFRNFMKTNDRPIKERNLDGHVYCGIEFRSWRVHNKIKQYELTSIKENRHRLNIGLLQPDIRRHFIRGIFDGDGCFTFDKRGYMFVELSGYLPLLKDIKNILVLDKIISENKKIVKNGRTIHRIRLSAYNSILFGNYIYENSNYYIRRKYNVFRSHVERLNNTKHINVLSDSLNDLRPVKNWNQGKQAEFEKRKMFNLDKV